jgi:hypothetical protein
MASDHREDFERLLLAIARASLDDLDARNPDGYEIGFAPYKQEVACSSHAPPTQEVPAGRHEERRGLRAAGGEVSRRQPQRVLKVQATRPHVETVPLDLSAN